MKLVAAVCAMFLGLSFAHANDYEKSTTTETTQESQQQDAMSDSPDRRSS
jgi:hypothetical protein